MCSVWTATSHTSNRRNIGKRRGTVIAQQSERVLEGQRGALHIAAFEGEFADLALDLGSSEFAVTQQRRAAEQFRGLVVLSPEHEDVAQPLGDRVLRGPIGRAGASVSDAVLLLGDFQ